MWNPVAWFQSVVNPSNELKALNALNSLLSLVKTVDAIIDPILALYPPLGAVAKLIDEGVVVIQAAITNLEPIVASQAAAKK